MQKMDRGEGYTMPAPTQSRGRRVAHPQNHLGCPIHDGFIVMGGVLSDLWESTPKALQEHTTNMDIQRIGTQPSTKGPSDWFTGTVRIDPLFSAPDPALVTTASVTFEPGARTAWHTHPLGQTLIVTAGCGWAQRHGGPVEEIHPGDVVWFPPNEKHWHGASPTTAVTHIAIQERLNGSAVTWLQHVTDDQYRK